MAGEMVKSQSSGAGALTRNGPLAGDTELLQQFGARIVTSLRPDDPDEQGLYLACMDRGEADGAAAVNLDMRVQHFMLRDATRRNKATNELESCALLTLIAPDGEVWSTTSAPCIRSFFLLAGIRGLPPWNPPRVLTVKKIPTSAGFNTYILTEASVKKPAGRKPKSEPTSGS